MKAIHLVWMTGLISAPLAGWFTAMVSDSDRGREVTAAKPTATTAEPADQPIAAAPQPTAKSDHASPQPVGQDELSRAKADLAKLLAALQSPDANSAIENHTLLKSQVAELTKARDAAAAALYNSGKADSGQAANRISELTRQLAGERRAADKSRRQVASLEALRDAQGWHSPTCPVCPNDSSGHVQASKTSTVSTPVNRSSGILAPIDQQQQTVQQLQVVPVEFADVIVCFQ